MRKESHSRTHDRGREAGFEMFVDGEEEGDRINSQGFSFDVRENRPRGLGTVIPSQPAGFSRNEN